MDDGIKKLELAARERDVLRSVQEAAPDLFVALETLMGIVDTPIGRRRLNLEADCIELEMAQQALTKARKYFQAPGDCDAFSSLLNPPRP